MKAKTNDFPVAQIENVIYPVRGQRVMLDRDLAGLYGVETKVLNQAVKRNLGRFPADFLFRLTPEEAEFLRSQIVILKEGGMRSQIVTASAKRNIRYLPYAFTEHGAIMAATVLNSRRAVEMSLFVVRAFVRMREQLLNRAELEQRLADIEKTLMAHDSALRDLYQKIRPLLLPPPEKPRRQIGFGVREPRSRYKVRAKRRG
jgi:hypothetical protein